MGQQEPGQWYQVDLKENQNFDLIVTNLGKTGDVPRGYVVKISNNGNNWREVASGENNNIYYVGNQNARYVRIEQTGTESHWWAIYEFYVLKSSSYDVGAGEVIKPDTTTPESTTKVPDTTPKIITTKVPDTTTPQLNIVKNDGQKITVKRGKIKKAKRISGKKAKIKIKKIEGVKNYQVKYSTNKSFKKKYTKTINVRKLNVVIKKLKANKKYYIKVRGYIEKDEVKIYGKWSKKKRLKTNNVF